MPSRFPGRKLFGWLSLIPLLILAIMAIGGYFDRHATRWLPATGPNRTGPNRPALVAVYFSGDMGLSVGLGEGALSVLRRDGIAVLAVNCSLAFRKAQSRAYVDALVADTLRRALTESGARQVVIMGGSFGADVIGTGIGALPPDLSRRIAAVVLIVPGTQVFFHANPTGLFYAGIPDSDPRQTVRALRGLPVTCIYGRDEADSLCRARELAGARRVEIPDGHLMLSHYRRLAEETARAALDPPPPLLLPLPPPRP
ncbi:AcvB/VirJ family lysyl-phosphatidylglycerol hydrolase [Novosphingobium sp. Fuku2-ISO-50]|uniref:AcvB/VirJ family lysyl-phosphatidylglycerol hydrolase n=1 Tax=Novosphingobium sp. Fuku2-ISO-50 TaxID=1739114 RepID=UPI00076C5E40|nr:AcvB/VirJ family lysyl-phosphatidylglycerol hydrolase [Novosphingobium sp. Fuku2-ISO-50]KUR76942.1 type IV secretion system protein VirJ [Novosphingobium sp. Fuku2-ISO-50]